MFSRLAVSFVTPAHWVSRLREDAGSRGGRLYRRRYLPLRRACLFLKARLARRFFGAVATFAFADCVLDTDRRELRHGDMPVALDPPVFDLLVYLLRNRDRVVSEGDLIATIWAGRIVSDSAVTTRRNAARKAIGDTGAAQRVIRTVTRRASALLATRLSQTHLLPRNPFRHGPRQPCRRCPTSRRLQRCHSST